MYYINGSFSYTPDSNYVGPDSFTYCFSDGYAVSNVAEVTFDVRTPGLPEFLWLSVEVDDSGAK